jgi:hypothetical protein
MGAIQAFFSDDLQQRHLRMPDLLKKASGHFARIIPSDRSAI